MKKEASNACIKERSKMCTQKLESAIRKAKFKKVLTQIMGLYYAPCVQAAQRQKTRIIHGGT